MHKRGNLKLLYIVVFLILESIFVAALGQLELPADAQSICAANASQKCNCGLCGCGGTIQCNGACSGADPTPANYGQPCGSGGKINCGGACSSTTSFGYRHASWTCYDEHSEKQGGETSCKPIELWHEYAKKSCSDKCTPDKTKCGVSYFSVDTPCKNTVCGNGICENEEEKTCLKDCLSCTGDYDPVCGQPPMPQCFQGFSCQQVMPQPKTYSNKCEMDKAGAIFLYRGACKEVQVCGNRICEEGEASYCICGNDPSCMAPCIVGTCPQDCQKKECTDSDGGKNFFVKGDTFGVNGKDTDYCVDIDSLAELYCDDSSNVQTYYQYCPNGCKDGACLKEKTPITATCSVSPTSANTGQTVTWSASASGGTGSYTYSWSGTDGLTGATQSVQKSYSTAGTKTARVTVTSGNQSKTQACGNSVSVTASNTSVGYAHIRATLNGAPWTGSFILRYTLPNGISGNVMTSVPSGPDQPNPIGNYILAYVSGGPSGNPTITVTNGSSCGAGCGVLTTANTVSNPLTFTLNFVSSTVATLNASCTVSPTSATTGQQVTWSASASGGTGSYTYSWSGTDGLSGATKSVQKSYATTGTKTGSVTVTSGTQSVTRACSNSVSVAPFGDPAIRILSPNGGETLIKGTRATISWEGLMANPPFIIKLWKGSTFIQNIAFNYFSSSPYYWDIPTTLADGSDYKLQIWSGNFSDVSDGAFTITAGTPILTASCSVSPVTANIGQSVTWSATTSGGTGTYVYSWSGTDGLSGATKSVQKSYATTGTKTARVTVTSGNQTKTQACGNSVNVTTSTTLPNLQAALLATPASVSAGTVMTFSGSISNSGNAPATATFNNRFRIDDVLGIPPAPKLTNLGPGQSSSVTSGPWVATPGTHTIRLCADEPTPVITESNENDNCAYRTFTVVTQILSSSCSVSQTSATTGQQVTWSASASGGIGLYTYSWSGTDGLTGATQSVQKSYSTAGTKTARVTVTSGNQTKTQACGNSVAVTTITNLTQAGIVAKNSSSCADLTRTHPGTPCFFNFAKFRQTDSRLIAIETKGISGSGLFNGQTHLVHNLNELNAVTGNLQPGDQVVLANGEWANVNINLFASGTASQPIIIRPETPGGVTLTGTSSATLRGAHLIVHGIIFRQGNVNSQHIVLRLGTGEFDPCNNCIANRVVIDGFNSAPSGYDTISVSYLQLNGKDITVANSEFKNKRNINTMIRASLPPVTATCPQQFDSSGTCYQRLHFLNNRVSSFTGNPANPPDKLHKILQVGDWTPFGHFSAFSIIEGNTFESSSGENSMFTMKADDIIIRRNTFRSNEGTLNLRSVDRMLIENNVFDGAGRDSMGAVRIEGRGHWVIHNLFKKLVKPMNQYYWPVALHTGKYEDVNTDGAGYTRVKELVIADNRFEDVATPSIAMGIYPNPAIGATLLPKNVFVLDNLFKFSGPRPTTPCAAASTDGHFCFIGGDRSQFVNLVERGNSFG